MSISNNMIKKIGKTVKKCSKSVPKVSKHPVQKVSPKEKEAPVSIRKRPLSRNLTCMSIETPKLIKKMKIEDEGRKENECERRSTASERATTMNINSGLTRPNLNPVPDMKPRPEALFYNQQMPIQHENFMPFPMPHYPPPPPHFMNTQFPFFFYPMPPMMPPINEQMPMNNFSMYKNFNNTNDIDLKNISQLVSSMSLSDEYLLEGQKLLSDLTFNTNSLSSFQDKLSSLRAPISSNKSNSSLSKKLISPASMLLNTNTNSNTLKTGDESSFQRKYDAKRKFERQKTFHHEEPIQRLSPFIESKNSMEKFFKDLIEDTEKKNNDAPIKSLNHLD